MSSSCLRRPTRKAARGLGTSAECWEIAEQTQRAKLAVERAEYAYEKGRWPKTKTRADQEALIRKRRDKYEALEAKFKREGC